MIEIARLTSITDASVQELNVLMKQLRANPTSDASAQEIRKLVDDDNIEIVAVKDGDRIIGVASLYVMPKIGKCTGQVEDVVVSEAYRGQGLGEKLMRELMRIAKERGVESLHLTSRPARVAGNKLYQKLGFEQKETNVYRLAL